MDEKKSLESQRAIVFNIFKLATKCQSHHKLTGDRRNFILHAATIFNLTVLSRIHSRKLFLFCFILKSITATKHRP